MHRIESTDLIDQSERPRNEDGVMPTGVAHRFIDVPPGIREREP